jgi:hypothetical protein
MTITITITTLSEINLVKKRIQNHLNISFLFKYLKK